MARATDTCNDVYQVENKVKFLTVEALRGVNSTIFDAHSSRLANVGKRDYVTGTALEQGCNLDKAVVCATTGAGPEQCSKLRGSVAVIDENIDITVSAQRQHPSQTLSEDQDSTEDSEDHGDSPSIEKLVDKHSRDASDSGSGNSTEW